MRLLLIFVGLFYVALFSVAQSAVPAYIQPYIDQAASVSAGGCNDHSLKNLAASKCHLSKISGTQETYKDSPAGEDLSMVCLFHAITMESSACIESATEKQIPIMTRRLVALQPFSIKKPPRMTS